MNNNQPICKVYKDGTKSWYLNGKLHREDGPAVELTNGTKYWCLNNKYHREDGPAIEFADGCKSWYLNDERIYVTMQEQFDRLMKSRNISKVQRELDKEFPTFEYKPTIWSKVVKRIKYELTGNELYL
jgi:hypothetical protein